MALSKLSDEQARRLLACAEEAREAKADLLDKMQVSSPNRHGERTTEQIDGTQAPLEAADPGGPQGRLQAELERLSPEARHEAMAASYVGRGEFAAQDWERALEAARSRAIAAGPERLGDFTALREDLAKGLRLLGAERG